MSFEISGEISVPGDKSLTHRALMFAAAGRGESHLSGLLSGADCRSTASILRALGVSIPEIPTDGGAIVVDSDGISHWREPGEVLDCGNSGTTARLMMGLLAARPFCATLTGDESLRSRPMRRITEPLESMGVRVRELEKSDRLPIELCGGPLQPLAYRSPKASAQIKSAVLLAGLSGRVPVSVREPIQSRDHTERMLRALGVAVYSGEGHDGGWEVSLPTPPEQLPALKMRVPGDPSSAAFFVALALTAASGELVVRNVGLNPTRTGFLEVARRMGGTVLVENEREAGGEPVGDLVVRPGSLRGVTVEAEEVPSMIDELPLLAVLATRAEGETVVRGADELRAKESDRIAAVVSNLLAVGARAEELPDGFIVSGSEAPLRGPVRTYHDHRIAMAFAVLGALPGNALDIENRGIADVSFPGFWDLLASLTAGDAAPRESRLMRPDGIIVAIDGPAGSGKSSTARTVAARLGYRHLDSGAFYRAITRAALDAGIPPERWDELRADELERLGVMAAPDERGYRMTIRGEDATEAIRAPEVNAGVSRMAAVAAVRDWLLGALRDAGARGGLVADGRDIGTIVFPDAELKVFLVCAPHERARRRLLEQGNPAPDATQVAAETERLTGRDHADETRPVAPLLQAPDAVLLDTTELEFEAQVRAILHLAEERIGR